MRPSPLGATTVAAGLLAAAGLALAPAAPATAATPKTASGAASASLFSANGTLGGVELADLVLAPTSASVDGAKAVTSTAKATNASLALLGERGELLVTAEQSAPPATAEGVTEEVLGVETPLLNASVARADARAVPLAAAACATTGTGSNVAASSSSSVADASLLPGSFGGPTGGTVVLDNTRDPRGAVVSTSEVALLSQGTGAGKAVETTATTQVTSVSLFGGELVVDVLTAPSAIVTATGRAGTAKAVTTQPVLRINGETLVAGETLRPLEIPGGPVLELTVGTVTGVASADGTTARATGNLLTLKVLEAAGEVPAATLSLGDLLASATSPVGGVRCATGSTGTGTGIGTGASTNPINGEACSPLRMSRLDSSAASVNPGSRFTYTITVSNPCEQPLTAVRIVNDLVETTPLPELQSATPEPISSDGLRTVFELAEIPAGGTKVITLVYEVPADAKAGTTYGADATVTAVFAGSPVEQDLTIDLPVVDAAGAGGCDLSRSLLTTSHRTVAPGDTYTQYVSVFNQGGRTCNGVTVTTTLPTGVTFASCTHDCTHANRVVTWKLPDLGPGASTTVSVTATVPNGAKNGTKLTSTGTVTAAGTDRVRIGPSGPTVAAQSTPAPRVTPTRGPAAAGRDSFTGGSTASTPQVSRDQLPRTGSSTTLPLAALMLVLTGVAVRRASLERASA